MVRGRSAATPPKAFRLQDAAVSPQPGDQRHYRSSSSLSSQGPPDENSDERAEKSPASLEVMARKRGGPSQVPQAASAICISAGAVPAATASPALRVPNAAFPPTWQFGFAHPSPVRHKTPPA